MPKASRAYLFSLLWCLLFIFKGNCQNSFGLKLEDNRRFTVIPFEVYNNLIVVKIKYNNLITLNFILDTGVRSAILTDIRMALLLNPKYVRPIKIGGLGGGEEVDAFIAAGLTFTMPGLIGKEQLLVVLAEDVFSLSKYIGAEVHGILGFEIFNRFVVEINYKQKIIKLHEPSRFKYRGKGEKVPLVIEDTKPFVKAEALIKEGEAVPVKLIVDTGAGHALSLYQGTHAGIQLPDTTIRSLLGRGISGDIFGHMGRIRCFQMGSFKFQNIITSFPDSIALNETFKANERQGNLGGDILSRFKVIFNYHDNYMVLEPQNRKNKIFNFNMSGVEVISKGDDLKTFIVDNVRKGSPGERAGILVGDEILSVQGKDHKLITLSEINVLFQSRPGRQVNLKIKRDGIILKKSFVLEKLI